jgi:hypothetical protein
MKASRDGLALYTMQNREEERLFRGESENIFHKIGNKVCRTQSSLTVGEKKETFTAKIETLSGPASQYERSLSSATYRFELWSPKTVPSVASETLGKLRADGSEKVR